MASLLHPKKRYQRCHNYFLIFNANQFRFLLCVFVLISSHFTSLQPTIFKFLRAICMTEACFSIEFFWSFKFSLSLRLMMEINKFLRWRIAQSLVITLNIIITVMKFRQLSYYVEGFQVNSMRRKSFLFLSKHQTFSALCSGLGNNKFIVQYFIPRLALLVVMKRASSWWKWSSADRRRPFFPFPDMENIFPALTIIFIYLSQLLLLRAELCVP